LPENQDLPSCLQLLEKHGFLSDNKLTLLEDFCCLEIEQGGADKGND